ncbi:hypothetical protein [Maricaulis sp.]|uniref:hypothetical protein n=1 Tax=Maricaulis sp. TaxID=1486257 RepID=UPI00262878AE|nr:hypothetical protein [Maricaulis sp.]
MLRVISSAVGLALLALSSPAMAQGIGQIPYIEQSLDSLEYEFSSVGVSRTWSYEIQSLRNDQYRDHTFQLTEPGYIGVGSDTDTRRIRLSRLEDGRPSSRYTDGGNRSANLYFNRAGTYTVRVYVEDCSESWCFYSIMTGYR